MKYKRALLILCTILFFLTALTFYLNRVIFPRLIKKFAVERIEETLKRKVEIGSIHFNWFRGFIIDKIKLYEKGSSDTVFAQADQVSFGILFFPGFQHSRITIPFVNVRSPSARLVRTGPGTWNFSDMYASSTAAAPSAPAATSVAAEKPPRFQIAWGGISISNGKFEVDGISDSRHWSEYFDNINLKLSLSYRGINYDFMADIPQEHGAIAATVYYQPLSKNTQAQIHLKNINTASYLSLISLPGMHLSSGIIQQIDLNINYTRTETSAQGDILMKNLDIADQDEHLKGDITIRGLDARYRNGDISAHGQMALNHAQIIVPGLSARGSVQTRVNDFQLTQQGLSFEATLHGQQIALDLKDRRVQVAAISLENIKVKKDKNGIQSVGNISTQGLMVQWPDQMLQGNIDLKDVTMNMKDTNDIQLRGNLQAENLSTTINQKNFSSRRLVLDDIRLNILDQKNIALSTKLSVDEMSLRLGQDLYISTSAKADRLLFDLNEGIIKISTTLNNSKGKFVFGHKTIDGDPQVELNLRMPLNDINQLTYKGSITLSGAVLKGFSPLQTMDNVDLDADFENDKITLNALSVDLLDTNVRVYGTVTDFRNPELDLVGEADELNLSQLSEIFPQIINAYGLSFDGTSVVKVKFKGKASNPLNAKILAVASVKNVSVTSSKWHQKIKNITGIVEATPDSLKWRDFTAVYQGKPYSLDGGLRNFKNPRILTTLSGPNLELKADLYKNNDRIKINNIIGKYLNASFNAQGSVYLTQEGPVFSMGGNASWLLEDLLKTLPEAQRKPLEALHPDGIISMKADLKGKALDWKNYELHALVTSPVINLMGYHLNDIKIIVDQNEGKVKTFSLDGALYGGTLHAVGSMDLSHNDMPYDLALNISGTDLHELKMDSPLKMEEIDGKFYLTTLAHGTVTDFKNALHATGSVSIKNGFLAEFNLFKGLLSVLNDALRLGQVMITDMDGNFSIDNQKITTEDLRLKGPTIVLLTKGWIGFDQYCNLDVSVDLGSGIVPAIAHDVLSSLNIHIYDKIGNPKFKKRISVPQVINSLLKNFLQ